MWEIIFGIKQVSIILLHVFIGLLLFEKRKENFLLLVGMNHRNQMIKLRISNRGASYPYVPIDVIH